jgi:hypothetical protein
MKYRTGWFFPIENMLILLKTSFDEVMVLFMRDMATIFGGRIDAGMGGIWWPGVLNLLYN